MLACWGEQGLRCGTPTATAKCTWARFGPRSWAPGRSNFDLKGDNLIKADTDNPNNSRSWWVSAMGCSEALGNLTVNNGSCGWEASNCFGQGLSGPRYLFVYVGK